MANLVLRKKWEKFLEQNKYFDSDFLVLNKLKKRKYKISVIKNQKSYLNNLPDHDSVVKHNNILPIIYIVQFFQHCWLWSLNRLLLKERIIWIQTISLFGGLHISSFPIGSTVLSLRLSRTLFTCKIGIIQSSDIQFSII